MTAFKESKDDVLNETLNVRQGKVYWENEALGRFKFPFYSSAERDAMTDVEEGLTIYNVTSNKLQFYNGTAWETITSA